MLLCVMGLLLAACTSGSPDRRVQPPAHVVADKIVVPPELTDEFEALQDADWEYLSLFRDPASALAHSIPERRAYVYYEFYPGAPPWVDEIGLQTMPSDEGVFDNLVADLAAQLDFTVTHSWYNDWPGSPEWGIINEDYRTTGYVLRTNRALSVGEMAWIADWIFIQAPDKFMYVSPSGDTDIVLP